MPGCDSGIQTAQELFPLRCQFLTIRLFIGNQLTIHGLTDHMAFRLDQIHLILNPAGSIRKVRQTVLKL